MATRIIALEYAIEGCIDGGAYLVRPDSIADIVDAIEECAGVTDDYPPGVSEEEWEQDGSEWYEQFHSEATTAAEMLWHFSDWYAAIPLPWRDGFVVRAWRVSPTEAKEWKE